MLCWNYSQAQKDKQPSPTKLQLLAVKNLVKALEKGTHVTEPVISTLEGNHGGTCCYFQWTRPRRHLSRFESSAQVNNAGTFIPQMPLPKWGVKIWNSCPAALGQGHPRTAVVSKGLPAHQLAKDLPSNTSLCTPGKIPPTSVPGKGWCAGCPPYSFDRAQRCPQYHHLIMYCPPLWDRGNLQVEACPWWAFCTSMLGSLSTTAERGRMWTKLQKPTPRIVHRKNDQRQSCWTCKSYWIKRNPEYADWFKPTGSRAVLEAQQCWAPKFCTQCNL